MHMLLSSKPWILGGNLSPDPVCLLTETGGIIKLDGLGAVLTSRPDMELPISPDDADGG